MGNETLICLNQNGEGIQEYPLIIIAAAIIFLVNYPLLMHIFFSKTDTTEVVSVSRTWRTGQVPVILWGVLLIIVVVYMIILVGCPAGGMIILWIFVILVGVVIQVNPSYPGEGRGDIDDVLGKKIHKGSAFLLFTFMLVNSILIVSMVIRGEKTFAAGVLILILMCSFYSAIVISMWVSHEWYPKTSLAEQFFCTLFGILLALVTDATLV